MNIPELYNRAVERMLEHVEQGTTDMAESTMRVPVSVYQDPELWQKEMEVIFKKLPIMVGLSSEIPNPGDFKTIEILDMPLLITRYKDGQVRAMINACTHRGMMVATEACGNRSVFSCPYHAWTFNGDGSLRGVAEAGKFGDVNKDELGLTQLPVYERGGLIFAVLTPGLDVDFEGFLDGMIVDIERLGFNDWYYCGQREIFGANWKIAYDGYLEGYHFAAAHPETIFARTFSNIMDFEAHGPHLRIGFPQKGVKEKLEGVPRDEFWRHENNGYDFIRTLFPNVSIFVAPEITQIAQLIPGPTPAENKTNLYYIYKGEPDEAKKEELTNMMDWLQGVVDREDYQLGLRVQKGLRSGAFDHVTFGRNERGNQYFHRWVEWYLAGDPDAPKPQL